MPMIPWFLDKYKPWTVRKAALQHLYLGKRPPMFTGVRTVEHNFDDDHLVMDLCLDFLAAEDMDAVLTVQMRRRIGLGISTNIHISRLQIEGKVRVGVKFLNKWPFLSRVRLCFENSPYVQMTARPLSTHGVNVSELPLIGGWMEQMVADVFEQSLVEPNMLVLDVEKLVSCVTTLKTPVSSMRDDWFEIQEKAPIAAVHLEIIEALDLKPSGPNGLADPFVKGSFATCQFKTKVQKRTLKPKWHEEFKVPIASWELPTMLVFHVRDKDQFHDDDLGFCKVDLATFRGGKRHDLWIPLQDSKMGRLHIAMKIAEIDTGSVHGPLSSKSFQSSNLTGNTTNVLDDSSIVSEKLEIINLGKWESGFVSIVSPGQPPVAKKWHQRHGMKRRDSSTNETEIAESMHVDTSSSEGAGEDKRARIKPRMKHKWGWRHSHGNKQDQTKPENYNEYLAVGNKGTTVRMKLEEPAESIRAELDHYHDEQSHDPSTPHDANRTPESPTGKAHMKNMAKGFMKHAGKKAHDFSTAFTPKGSSREPENAEPVDITAANIPVTPVREPKLCEEQVCLSNDTSPDRTHMQVPNSEHPQSHP